MLFWTCALAALAADLATKRWVFDALLPHPGMTRPLVPGVLWLSHHINRGGVWGFASGHTLALILLTALILPAVILMAYHARGARLPLAALGMLLGGAIGNFYDRIRYAGVRDFLDLRWWPVFNVADAAIVVGVILYLAWAFFLAPPEPGEGDGEREKASGAAPGAETPSTRPPAARSR